MFKHILIPTDGSELARKAIDAGIALAKELRATVVGYCAAESVERVFSAEGSSIRPTTIADFQNRVAEQAREHLDYIEKACNAAGVACEMVMTTPATPFQGIIEAARSKQCDIIVMASHGRGGLATLILGSVTQKVLAHSAVPVLVYR